MTGDSATAFFSAGALEADYGGTGDDTSGTTGVPEITAGNWTYAANVADLASSTSAELAGVLSDETGSGVAVFGTQPTITPTLIISDSAADPPLNVTERSSVPSSPASGDIYLDDGTNTGSGNPGWRRYTGAAWEDVSAAGGTQYGLHYIQCGNPFVACGATTTPSTTWTTFTMYTWVSDIDASSSVSLCFQWQTNSTNCATAEYKFIECTNSSCSTSNTIRSGSRATSFTDQKECDTGSGSNLPLPSASAKVALQFRCSAAGTTPFILESMVTWTTQ